MKISRKIMYIILSVAVLVQLIILTYNHAIGFSRIDNIFEFIIRLSFGSILSFFMGLFLLYSDSKVISKLDKKFPWRQKAGARILPELFSILIVAIAGASFLTGVSHFISHYKSPVLWVLFINSSIGFVVNLLFMSVLEALKFYKENQDSKLLSAMLSEENSTIKLDLLKSQLNPHFLFNSLNVLSAVMKKDTVKAEKMIEELSTVYRYTLEVIDRSVSSLRSELEYAKSYLYMQQIRFENMVKINVNISNEYLDYLIPSLTLQIILENAFKHNQISEEHPLEIELYIERGVLCCKNNYSPKSKNTNSTKVGLENLKKRYSFISGDIPEFALDSDSFTAKLPLIIPE